MIVLFPDALGAIAMPNHIHLILPRESPRASQKLLGLLGSASRRIAQPRLWEPIPNPSTIPDLFHLRRQIRYVALNPCRKSLCKDPMEWYWSTYREMLGASIGRHEVLSRLCAALAQPQGNFRVAFHAYVSGDPSVRISGTPLPVASPPKAVAEESIQHILVACASALRLLPHHLPTSPALKHLFIHAAYRHGWRQPKVLASLCEIKRNSVHWYLNKEAPQGLPVVDLCLGDTRLTSFAARHLKSRQRVE